MTVPIALTIAGSDSSGGAGIQADLKTFSALQVYGASVITATTAQNTVGVQDVFVLPVPHIQAQIRSVLDDLNVRAIKTGMLATAEVISTVADMLSVSGALPLVVDPVMVAQSGASLLVDEAVASYKTKLFPLVTVITPNLPEAAKLLGAEIAHDENEMVEQGKALLNLGARAVFIKGGHGTGDESVDLLVQSSGITRFAAKRLPTKNTHGTGCSIASAITAHLARGFSLEEAVNLSKIWLTAALAAADTLDVGQSAGPVHHFHEFWKNKS